MIPYGDLLYEGEGAQSFARSHGNRHLTVSNRMLNLHQQRNATRKVLCPSGSLKFKSSDLISELSREKTAATQSLDTRKSHQYLAVKPIDHD